MDKETYKALQDLLGLVDEHLYEMAEQGDRRATAYKKDYKKVCDWYGKISKEHIGV